MEERRVHGGKQTELDREENGQMGTDGPTADAADAEVLSIHSILSRL